MNAAGFLALLSHWRRNPIQLFTLITGLALATALWAGVQAINVEARASYDRAAATLGEGQFDQLVPRAGGVITQSQFVSLRRAGWLVGPVLEGRMTLGEVGVRVVGVEPLTSPGGLGPVKLGGEVTLADFLSSGVLFADAETASHLAHLTDMRIVIDPGVAPGTVLTDIGVAQQLLDRPAELSRLIVATEQPLGRAPLDALAPGLVRRPAQGGNDVGRLTDSFHLNLTAFGLLSFAVGIFIVHGAIGLAFEQRRGMVRTLRALGMSLRRLVLLMLMELLVFALVAGAIGVLLGYLVAAMLLPDVAATLDGLYGAQVGGTLQLRPAWWLSGMAIAVLGGLVAASGALLRIAHMPLLASARAQAWSVASARTRRLQTVSALVLLAGAVVLGLWGWGLIMGFALLACLLIGAALALPILLDGVLSSCQHLSRGVISQWFWADTRQQLPGLSLALMALLLAMAANVGVSTMVSSFRLTFTGFLDQRLASELYVNAESAENSAALQAFLMSRADAVLPVLSTDTRLAGFDAEILGTRVGPTYTENWAFLAADADVWERVKSGNAVLVNEQLARRANIWVGDALLIAPGTQRPIAGVFGDYGNPVGQAILGEDLFRKLFPEVIATRFGLRTKNAAKLRNALLREYGLPNANIINQEGIKAFSLGVFERTFTVTAALNVLTLSVAGFAILMSLLTLAAMRVPQLAPIWALGMTRKQLGQLELTRAVVLALLTAVLALPLGLILAWVLLSVVNVEAFGWKLPIYYFPADYARLGFFALAAAVIAALWPARRLATTPPADLLKVFANER